MPNRYYHLLAILIFAMLPMSLMAQQTQEAPDSALAPGSIPEVGTIHKGNYSSSKKHKIVAVISSFTQDSPWSDDYIPLVTAAASKNPNTYCDIYHLQSLQITDMEIYEAVKKNLFEYYDKKKPDYVVMIGKMAFTMRDEMKERWGDIPMFLIANSADLAPLDYYFSGISHGSEAEVVQKSKLFEMQKEFNFTALIVPYLYRQTVQLMVEAMHHQIDELVFVAVPTYIDRYNSKRISEYLADNYPGIKYRWLYADSENIEELRSLLVERQLGTGILLSNWAVIGVGPLGERVVVNQEAKLLSSSVNPVFVASASLINNGAVGGVFLNRRDIQNRIDNIMADMLNGKNMSEIPVYKCEDATKVINYKRAQQYGLSLDNLGDDVEWEGRSRTFWQKYHWQTIIGLLLLFLFGMLFWKRNKSQAKEIEALQMHRKFVECMPIAYARATLYFGHDGKHVNNVLYSGLNDAMQNLVSQNGCRTGEYVLFPISFINEKVLELLEKGHKIDFVHHFENTDTYYDIFIDLADSDGAQNNKTTVRELDIFAVDVTNRVRMESELKDLSRKLDLTINVTDIIPWEWDIKTDVLRFDAYSLFGRQLHDVDDMKQSPSTYLDVNSEFMTLIHPDDRPYMEENSRLLLTKEKTSFSLRYRLHVVRDGMDVYQWVKIKGRLTEFDSKGNPTKAAGGMWTLEEDDIIPDPLA